MNRNALLTRLLMLLVLLPSVVACTEVDLCEEAEHPHRAHTMFHFDWQGYTDRPDSMLIASIRVLNLWKCGIIFSTKAGDPNYGRYVYNPPEIQPEWAYDEYWNPPPPVVTPPKPGEFIFDTETDYSPKPFVPDPEITQFEHFALRDGTYKFLAVNKDATEVDVSAVYNFLRATGDTLQMTDVRLRYLTYEREDTAFLANLDSAVHERIMSWADYNPVLPYIKSNITPLYYDVVDHVNIYKEKTTNDVTFRPRPVTQNIDVYVDFEKDISEVPFTVDTVLAEVAGIPLRISLVDGYIDMSSTAKMIFTTELMSGGHTPIAADSPASTQVSAHGRISVTTVIANQNESNITGPGIMQLLLHCTAINPADGSLKTKWIPGRVNMSKTLERSKLIELTDDGQHARQSAPNGVINLKIETKLKGKDILDNSDESGGVITWTEAADIDIPEWLE